MVHPLNVIRNRCTSMPSTVRQRLIVLLVVMAVLGCGILAASIRGPSAPLPPGTAIPKLDLVDWRTGSTRALGSASLPTVVILMRSECSYCKEELTDIAAHFDALRSARYVLVTSETAPPADYAERWPRLASDSTVAWVRAPAAQLAAALHTQATPSIFIYDRGGHLRRSFRGLTGVEAIGRELASAASDSTLARLPH